MVVPVWCLTADSSWDRDHSNRMRLRFFLLSHLFTPHPPVWFFFFSVSSINTGARLENWSRFKNRTRGKGFGRCSLSQISASVQFSAVQSVPESWGTAVSHMGTGARTGTTCQEHLGSAWILEWHYVFRHQEGDGTVMARCAFASHKQCGLKQAI